MRSRDMIITLAKARERYYPDIPPSTFYRRMKDGRLPGAIEYNGEYYFNEQAILDAMKNVVKPPRKQGRPRKKLLATEKRG